MFNIRRRNTFPRAEKSTLALFPLFFALKEEGSRERAESREFFSSFFLRFFFDALLALLSLSSFSLFFSLSFLSSSLLCVFAREFSPHK